MLHFGNIVFMVSNFLNLVAINRLNSLIMDLQYLSVEEGQQVPRFGLRVNQVDHQLLANRLVAAQMLDQVVHNLDIEPQHHGDLGTEDSLLTVQDSSNFRDQGDCSLNEWQDSLKYLLMDVAQLA